MKTREQMRERKRNPHKMHPDNPLAIWKDCPECNPLANDATFLEALKEPLNAAITVAFAASTETYQNGEPSHALPSDHRWFRLREEIQRRSKALKPKTEAEKEIEVLIYGAKT